MRTTFIGGVAALALAAVAGGALAQTPAAPRATSQTHAQPHALRGDADRDGRLSQAEFVEARTSRLAAMDANGDGSVTREEMRAAMQARMAERASQRFAKLDADGDGAISRAEFDAGHAALGEGPRPHRAMRHAGGPRGGLHRGMNRGPRPGQHPDGARERGPVVIADVRARATEQFAKLDANGDGFVTAEEQRAAWRAGAQQRRAAWQARRQQQPSPQAPVSE